MGRLFEYKKDYNMFRDTIFTHDTTLLGFNSDNIPMKSSNQRTVKIKLGKIADSSLLKSLKNGEANAWNSLLTYAKTNNTVFEGSLTGKFTNYTSSWNGLPVSKSVFEKNAYYFLYVELDDENGKYYPVEAVTIAGVNLYGEQQAAWGLWFYGSKDFKWLGDSTEVNPTEVKPDDTRVQTVIPNAGGNAIVISVIGVIAVIGIIAKIKYNKYKDIK